MARSCPKPCVVDTRSESGASSMPFVKFFLIILAPVAVPLAKVLDYFLEEDVGTVHTKNEMMHYLKLHAKRRRSRQRVRFGDARGVGDEGKRVREVMTPLEDVYMLPESTHDYRSRWSGRSSSRGLVVFRSSGASANVL